MKQSEHKAVADRRSFLKLVGLGALGGSAVLGAAPKTAEASDAAQDKDGLYKETEHVKTYYDLAKF